MFEKREFKEKDIYEDYTISERKDGRFFARVRIGRDTNTQKYTYKSFYASNELDVKIKVREFIEGEISSQNTVKEKEEQFGNDIEHWLYKEKFGTVKPVSFDRLEQIYQNQIKPNIDDIKTKNVTSEYCKNILNENLAKGYSYSTLLKIYRFLKEFFSTRTENGELLKNPMSGVKLYTKDFVLEYQKGVNEERKKAIKKKNSGADLSENEEALAFSKLKMNDKTEIRFLTDSEIEKIKNVAYNGYMIEWKTKNGKTAQSGPFVLKQSKYFLFILNTGIRKGEAVALKYSDIDFKKQTMTISRNTTTARKRDKNGKATGGFHSVEGTPKTKGSAATVPINSTAIEILKEMLAEEPKGYKGYIANENGKPISESALRKRFDNLLRQAKVEHCGIHSLRHTFASKLFEATNGNSKLVSELVRHSSVSFTEDIYIHLKEKYKEKTIANFSI